MTEREKIIQLFHEADVLFGWKPGHGNETVLGYLEAFRVVTIADFLESSGQYLTNDASRAACIKQAQADAFEQAAKVCETFDPNPGQWSELFEYTQQRTANDCAEAIRQLGKEKK